MMVPCQGHDGARRCQARRPSRVARPRPGAVAPLGARRCEERAQLRHERVRILGREEVAAALAHAIGAQVGVRALDPAARRGGAALARGDDRGRHPDPLAAREARRRSRRTAASTWPCSASPSRASWSPAAGRRRRAARRPRRGRSSSGTCRRSMPAGRAGSRRARGRGSVASSRRCGRSRSPPASSRRRGQRARRRRQARSSRTSEETSIVKASIVATLPSALDGSIPSVVAYG
jgi:hypothetical protein